MQTNVVAWHSWYIFRHRDTLHIFSLMRLLLTFCNLIGSCLLWLFKVYETIYIFDPLGHPAHQILIIKIKYQKRIVLVANYSKCREQQPCQTQKKLLQFVLILMEVISYACILISKLSRSLSKLSIIYI